VSGALRHGDEQDSRVGRVTLDHGVLSPVTLEPGDVQ